MKAHYKSNKILIDWLSFTISNIDIEVLIDLFGFGDMLFVELRGNRGYASKYFCDGVNINYGKTSDDMADFWVELSGQGCRVFESYGHGDWIYLLSNLLDNDTINITRLDVAYDDFNGLINLDYIVADVLSQHFISKSRSKRYKCGSFCVELSSDGTCVTIGKCKSNMMVRIYDKAAERNAEAEFEHWVRCEEQLRYQNAMQFCKLLCKHQVVMPGGDFVGISMEGLNIDKLYFGVLNNYLRFIDVSANSDTNLWRKPMAEHWERFAHSVTDERVSLWVKPGVEYNVLRLDRVVEHYFSGAVVTYTLIHGIDKLVSVLIDRIPYLNTKYKYLLRDHYKNNNDVIFPELVGGSNAN